MENPGALAGPLLQLTVPDTPKLPGRGAGQLVRDVTAAWPSSSGSP